MNSFLTIRIWVTAYFASSTNRKLQDPSAFTERRNMRRLKTMFGKTGLRSFVAILLVIALAAAYAPAASAAEEPQFSFQYADTNNTVLTGYVGTLPQELQIPAGVISIEEQAFQRARALRKVILPEGIEKIGRYAFDSCENLKEINFPSSLKSIGGRALSYTALTSVILPDGLLELGAGAFSHCYYLINAFIPDSVKSDLATCFNNCTRLSEVHLPANMESLGETCFTSCASLTHIDLPKTLKSIGDVNWISLGCFYGCIDLVEINFPSGLEEIGSCDFGDCYRLKEIHLPASLTKIGRHAFKIYDTTGAQNPDDKNVPPRTIYFDGSRQAWDKLAEVDLGLRPEDIVICAGETPPSPAPTPDPSPTATSAPSPVVTPSKSPDPVPSVIPSTNPDPVPSAVPAPTIPAIAGYDSGWVKTKPYYVKTSGASILYYLKSSSGRMGRVSAPYITDAEGVRYYPINHGGAVLFPRLKNNRFEAYCIYRDGMEIPVLTVSADVKTPTNNEGYQTGVINGKTYYAKTSGASTLFYLKSSSGRMARVSAPYVTIADGTRYYPVNYGGTVLFPKQSDGRVISYATGSAEEILTTISPV